MNAYLRVGLITVICVVAASMLLSYIGQTPQAFATNNTTFFLSDRDGTLEDYYSEDLGLELAIRKTISSLSDEELVGQLFMPAWDNSRTLEQMVSLVQRYKIGGVMTLRKDVSKRDVQRLIDASTRTSTTTMLKGLLSIDAEPSLIKYRLPQLGTFPNTETLKTETKSYEESARIAQGISSYGYRLNFAPVLDNGTNVSVIGNRAFSTDPDQITTLSNVFINAHQSEGVYATIKHFPGHGMVSGDTHYQLQSVPADLPELEVFNNVIKGDSQPVFLMVGHLAVNDGRYDTAGKPATISQVISTDLLRNELAYEGIVITDAMNMGALNGFGDVDIQALDAGADIVLMPRTLGASYQNVLSRIQSDPKYRIRIFEKVNRIVRAKLVSQWLDSRSE